MLLLVERADDERYVNRKIVNVKIAHHTMQKSVAPEILGIAECPG